MLIASCRLPNCCASAVREAALLARAIQKELVTPALTKDDRSPVTVGDFAVQAVVARRLAERLPGCDAHRRGIGRGAAARRRHRRRSTR